jgi:hypothetical protein
VPLWLLASKHSSLGKRTIFKILGRKNDGNTENSLFIIEILTEKLQIFIKHLLRGDFSCISVSLKRVELISCKLISCKLISCEFIEEKKLTNNKNKIIFV